MQTARASPLYIYAKQEYRKLNVTIMDRRYMAALSKTSGSTPTTPSRTAALTLGAVGVVYGDIGTSPLYAMRESLALVAKDGLHEHEILGVVSLLVWSLLVVVTLKYICLLMRADNNGEGGVLSLLALVQPASGKKAGLVIICGMIGAALFYGDAMLTPAISVLSAVEGLKLVTPDIEPFILPITLFILIGLFAIQRFGTGIVAKWFGPITLVWFISMAAFAVPHIAEHPDVLRSLSPYYAAEFMIDHKLLGITVLGAVFLAVTGAEALYADMGHFGRLPIRIAWMLVVFPALCINYLGQAALILSDRDALENPFFLLAPSWGLVPLLILAGMATVIASQAVITGAFSLTRQAIQLGLLPRFEIRHTSANESGQIYLPRINLLLAIGVVCLVIEFKTSAALAAAYGIAVAGTMMITTLLAILLMRRVWHKSWAATLTLLLPFVLVDITFLISNLLKVGDGGYVPLLLALAVIGVMLCWRRGTHRMQIKESRNTILLQEFLPLLDKRPIPKVPGTAIFLTQNPTHTPTALMHNLKHNKMLHEHNVILSVSTDPAPRIEESQRIHIESVNPHFTIIRLHFGYMETPNIAQALLQCRRAGMKFDIMATSFFISRRVVRTTASTPIAYWADKIYILLSRNATRPADFFHIPTDRVVELGTQVTL